MHLQILSAKFQPFLFRPQCVDPSGNETGIFQEAADALAPAITSSSAAMILAVGDKQALVFYYLCHLSVEKLRKMQMYFNFFAP